MREIQNNGTEKGKKIGITPRFIVIIAVIVAVVIVLCICLPMWLAPQQQPQQAAGVGFDPSQTTAAEVIAEEQDEHPNVTLPGWGAIVIPKDTKEITSGIDFFNPEQNKGYYDLTFELLVDTDGSGNYKSLYKSDLVKSGNHIYTITLSEPLKEGTYSAKVFMQPFDTNNPVEGLNNGEVELQLIVQ